MYHCTLKNCGKQSFWIKITTVTTNLISVNWIVFAFLESKNKWENQKLFHKKSQFDIFQVFNFLQCSLTSYCLRDLLLYVFFDIFFQFVFCSLVTKKSLKLVVSNILKIWSYRTCLFFNCNFRVIRYIMRL